MGLEDNEYTFYEGKEFNFGDFPYESNRRIKQKCVFLNCTFNEGAFFHWNTVDCIFVNCTFKAEVFWGSRLSRCIFRNTSFPDGFRKVFVKDTHLSYDTILIHCDYDDKFLEDAKKDWPCPPHGEFIGWKKVRLCYDDDNKTIRDYGIVMLKIPGYASRSSGLSNKCRCGIAVVSDIQTIDGKSIACYKDICAESMYPGDSEGLKYILGDEVYPDSFDTDPFNECSHGIHFFMTRQEAVAYVY